MWKFPSTLFKDIVPWIRQASYGSDGWYLLLYEIVFEIYPDSLIQMYIKIGGLLSIVFYWLCFLTSVEAHQTKKIVLNSTTDLEGYDIPLLDIR